MHIVKSLAFIFVLLSVLFLAAYLMGWGLSEMIVLSIIGVIFISGSIFGYLKMYSGDE